MAFATNVYEQEKSTGYRPPKEIEGAALEFCERLRGISPTTAAQATGFLIFEALSFRKLFYAAKSILSVFPSRAYIWTSFNE